MPSPTPAQVDRLLSGIEYPAGKEEISQQADRKRTAKAVRALLERLPERTYQTPANVRQELEKLEPALKGGAEAPSAKTPQTETAPSESEATGGLAVPQPVRDVVQTARVQGQRVLIQAGTLASSQVDERRPQIADGIVATATTLRETRQKLEEQGQQPLARAAEFAAGKLESASTYIRQTEARNMGRQVTDFAKRQPLVVLAAGTAIGLVVTRLIKSADLQPLASIQSSGGVSGGPTDATGLLEADHKRIRQQLQRAESAATNQRQRQLQSLKGMLEAHERMEEEVFYPALKDNLAMRDLIMESYAEHHVVDEIMAEIEQTDPNDEMWKARFTAMRENLEQHVDEEESQLLPRARTALTPAELSDLGRRMQQLSEQAPQPVRA